MLNGYFHTPTSPNGLTACAVWRARLAVRRATGRWPAPTPSLWAIEAATTMEDLREAGRMVTDDEPREVVREAYVRRRRELR